MPWDEVQRKLEHVQRAIRRESIESNPKLKSQTSVSSTKRGSNNGSKYMLGKMYSGSRLSQLEQCFGSADQDKDGFLNRTEFQYWLQKHGCPATHSQIGKVLEVVDTDGDGKVSFDEFLAFCQRFQLDRVEPTDCLESRDRDSNVLFQEEEKTLHPSQKVWNGRSPENSGLVGQNIKYFEYQLLMMGNHGPQSQIERHNRNEGPSYGQRQRGKSRRTQREGPVNDEDFDLNAFCEELRHPREELVKAGVCAEFQQQRRSLSQVPSVGTQAERSGSRLLELQERRSWELRKEESGKSQDRMYRPEMHVDINENISEKSVAGSRTPSRQVVDVEEGNEDSMLDIALEGGHGESKKSVKKAKSAAAVEEDEEDDSTIFGRMARYSVGLAPVHLKEDVEE